MLKDVNRTIMFLNGIQEVSGSIPLISTIETGKTKYEKSFKSRDLRLLSYFLPEFAFTSPNRFLKAYLKKWNLWSAFDAG